MARTTERRAGAARSRGFALLIVLWTLVLIAFVVAHVTATGRVEARIAGNLAENAKAAAAADGAIYEAIFYLKDPRPERRWTADGSAHELQIGASRVTLWVVDEDGRVNPNLASAALLEGLLRGIGNDPQSAADLAKSIAEWVGSARHPAKPDELLAEYRAAGLDYAPPEAPLESIDELGRVRGMSAPVLQALRPHLSLFAPAEPSVASADAIVVDALTFARGGAPLGSGEAPRLAPTGQGPATERMRVTAHGPGKAEASRTAIVRLGNFTDEGYRVLSWRRGID